MMSKTLYLDFPTPVFIFVFVLQEASLQGVLRRALFALPVLGELTSQARHLRLLQADAQQIRILNIL